MSKDLPADIVAELLHRYQADLERTRRMYSQPWRTYTWAGHFERWPETRERFLPWVIAGVVGWLIACLVIGTVVHLVDAVLGDVRPAPLQIHRNSTFGALK